MEEILHRINTTEAAWGLVSGDDINSICELGWRTLYGSTAPPPGFDTKNYDGLRDAYMEKIQKFRDIIHEVEKLQEMDRVVPPSRLTVGERLSKLVNTLNDGYESTYRMLRYYNRRTDPTPEDSIQKAIAPVTSIINPDAKLNPYQEVLVGWLNHFDRHNYRKYQGLVMNQIMTTSGFSTSAWAPVKIIENPTIEKYLFNCIDKETDYDLWLKMSSRPGIVKDVASFLDNTSDVQFPSVDKDRSIWSFRNGVLNGRDLEFTEYPCKPTKSAAKYFDATFDPKWMSEDTEWYSISTPNLQRILNYQEFPAEVCMWAYAFIGRLCFEVGDLDDWQVMPFFKGLAGTGKSTVLFHVVKHFYDEEDVKTLSNNIEPQFGLSSIKDAKVWLAPEVKGDLKLDQAEFQSIISGENVSIAVKHQPAISKDWKVPGAMAGNEAPNYRDNSGSVMRRIVPFPFTKHVKDSDKDGLLPAKLRSETPAILAKCLRAYQWARQQVGSKGIWSKLPVYFEEARKQIAHATSPVQHFLDNSSRIKFGPNEEMPMEVCRSLLKSHCNEYNIPLGAIKQEMFTGSFSMLEVTLEHKTDMCEGRSYTGEWVVGIGVADAGVVGDF